MKKHINDFKFKDIIYFDSAATSQMPEVVINSISDFYANNNAQPYRGVYKRSEIATELYENARSTVASFINADSITFVKSTTEGINFIANSWAVSNIRKQDNIILSYQEHHSNILPWLELSKKIGFSIKFIKLNSDGSLNYSHYLSLLDNNTKLVAITYVSNVLGIINDIKYIQLAALAVGAKTLVDAAQAVGHISIDVKYLDIDFLTFSAHKMLGPSGIGALYIKNSIKENLTPYQFGGNMISDINVDWSYSFANLINRFEAGTQPVAQAIGFARAIKYYNENLNLNDFSLYLNSLNEKLITELISLPNIQLITPTDLSKSTCHIVSFNIKGIHGHDVASYLDSFNIAVRAGFHCAKPLHDYLGLLNGSIRVSFHCYNSLGEVDFLIDKIKKLIL